MNSERTGDISPRTGHSVSFTNTIIVIAVRRGEVEELMLDTQCVLNSLSAFQFSQWYLCGGGIAVMAL